MTFIHLKLFNSDSHLQLELSNSNTKIIERALSNSNMKIFPQEQSKSRAQFGMSSPCAPFILGFYSPCTQLICGLCHPSAQPILGLSYPFISLELFDSIIICSHFKYQRKMVSRYSSIINEWISQSMYH